MSEKRPLKSLLGYMQDLHHHKDRQSDEIKSLLETNRKLKQDLDNSVKEANKQKSKAVAANKIVDAIYPAYAKMKEVLK